MVVHMSNPSTRESESGQSQRFQARLLYKVISRTFKTFTQRNPFSNNQKTKQTNKEKNKLSVLVSACNPITREEDTGLLLVSLD